MTHEERHVRLRAEVDRAKHLFEIAKRNLEVTQGLVADLGLTHPDAKLTPAIMLYRRTLADYRAALSGYNQVLLGDERPDETGSKQMLKAALGTGQGGKIPESLPPVDDIREVRGKPKQARKEGGKPYSPRRKLPPGS